MAEWDKEKPDLKDIFQNNKAKEIVFSIQPLTSQDVLLTALEHHLTK